MSTIRAVLHLHSVKLSDLDGNQHRSWSTSIDSMLIRRWIVNAIVIHRLSSYGPKTPKYGHASCFNRTVDEVLFHHEDKFLRRYWEFQ